MLNKLQNDSLTTGWRGQAIFITILLMISTLFISRALLSLSMAGFIILCCFHKNIREHLRKFLSTPLLWGITILFFLPLLSGAWSEDLHSWSKIVQVKLPLLAFPFAFAGSWLLTKKQWTWVVAFFLFAILAGTFWSIAQYITDRAAIHEAYLKAKTIPVPLGGDHIRFSWMVCTGVIISIMLLVNSGDKRVKFCLSLLSIWLIVYLHVLAARTGLFACYLFLFAFALYQLFQLKRKVIGVAIILAVLLIPFVAWLCFPTFQNRIKYLRYDLDYVMNNDYLPGATDGNRLFSIKAGWNIVKENPLGVGAGDLRQVTKEWYDKKVPGMIEMDKIYPSNEWLIYGGFTGWPGIVLFTVIMLLPFFTRTIQHRFYWYCFHGTAIFSFLVDTGLEVQFGVFLYSFITCCWWKAMQKI